LAATISANVKIPAFFSCDNSKVFTLRLCTFANTPANSRFEFMRSPQPPVTLFYAYGETDAVVQSEPAPCTTHAAFHSPQSFTIRMPAFKAGRYKLLPNERKITEM